MPVPTAKNGCSTRFRRNALLVLLIAAAGPVMAATGIGSDCDAAGDEATAGVLQETVTIKRSGSAPRESLRLRETDTAKSRTATSDLGNLLPRPVSAPGSSSRELRSAALADALERRQPRRSALRMNDGNDTAEPRVEAEIPGVTEEEALVFRREMFRTDI